MNYLQTELILLNLLRHSEEFVVALLGLMPEPDAGSFYKRLSTLYEIFKTDKTGFAASSFRLGQVALFLKEYAALTKQNIDQVDIPEILSPAISWEDIEDKPEFFAPYSHFHKWEEIANKPVKYLPVTHQHIWNDVTDKPTTFPPAEHTHAAAAVAWNDVTDKPTTFPPSEHTHEAQAVAWTDVTDKPTTFPPEAHTHPDAMADWNTLQNKPTTFPPAEHTHEAQAVAVAWSEVTDKPATFPPYAHLHAYADITDAPTISSLSSLKVHCMQYIGNGNAQRSISLGLANFMPRCGIAEANGAIVIFFDGHYMLPTTFNVLTISGEVNVYNTLYNALIFGE